MPAGNHMAEHLKLRLTGIHLNFSIFHSRFLELMFGLQKRDHKVYASAAEMELLQRLLMLICADDVVDAPLRTVDVRWR